MLTDDHHWIKPVAVVASCNVFFLKSLSIFRVAIYDPPDIEGFLQPKNKSFDVSKGKTILSLVEKCMGNLQVVDKAQSPVLCGKKGPC